MSPADYAPALEQACAAVLVVVLIGLAGYYGWRQWRSLGLLRRQPELAPADRHYHRAQAWRRLVSSGLMLILAGLLAGYYLLDQDRPVRELTRQGEEVQAAGGRPVLSPEQRSAVNRSIRFWLVFVVVLVVWLCLAFFDLWAIRRFGLRKFRQIQADHWAAVESQVGRLRTERNGHN